MGNVMEGTKLEGALLLPARLAAEIMTAVSASCPAAMDAKVPGRCLVSWEPWDLGASGFFAR